MATWLSPIHCHKNFAYRNKKYLVSNSETAFESVNVEDEFLILPFQYL